MVDRLLIQELACDPDFAAWFISRCSARPNEAGRITELNQSRTRRGRETDVEVHWTRDDGTRLLILIENKIEAAFQMEQLEDYHLRGQGMTREKKCEDYRVALLAPKVYLKASPKSGLADIQISYEDLRTHFADHPQRGVRREYVVMLMDQAVAKGSRQYVGVADLAVTNFWSQYTARFNAILPGWAPRQARGAGGARPEKSDIVYLYSPDATLAGLRLAHKLKLRQLELSFEGVASLAGEFETYISKNIRPPATLEWSGAKGAVRRVVPRVSPWDPFTGQEAAVDRAVAIAAELEHWFRPHAGWWREFRARAKSTA